MLIWNLYKIRDKSRITSLKHIDNQCNILLLQLARFYSIVINIKKFFLKITNTCLSKSDIKISFSF